LFSLVFFSIATQGEEAATLTAGVFSPARPAPDFSLSGSNGVELKLSSYRGKVVLLAFGYTSCQEVCPVTLAILATARKQLGAAANELQVVYITVDPERDGAEQMRKFVTAFDRTFIGGTGTARQLAKVRQDYGIVATKKFIPEGYAVAHSSFVYLIDRQGSLRALMPFGRNAADFVHDVRILLKQ